MASWEDSTNDISHYLGVLDPWYERNVLGLMYLPPEVLCQVSRLCGGGQSSLAAVIQPRFEDSGFGEIHRGPGLAWEGRGRVYKKQNGD